MHSSPLSTKVLLASVRLTVADRHRSDVLRTLRILRGRTTAKAGCLAFDVSEGLDTKVLSITERWATRDDLDAHIRSADYKLLLAVIDLAAASPEIRFESAEALGGLDLVSAVRSGADADAF